LLIAVIVRPFLLEFDISFSYFMCKRPENVRPPHGGERRCGNALGDPAAQRGEYTEKPGLVSFVNSEFPYEQLQQILKDENTD